MTVIHTQSEFERLLAEIQAGHFFSISDMERLLKAIPITIIEQVTGCKFLDEQLKKLAHEHPDLHVEIHARTNSQQLKIPLLTYPPVPLSAAAQQLSEWALVCARGRLIEEYSQALAAQEAASAAYTDAKNLAEQIRQRLANFGSPVSQAEAKHPTDGDEPLDP